MSRISLDGDWTLTGFAPESDKEPLRLTGRVPGHVHDDLLRAGLIADPFWREQAEQCQWVETWDWEYERTFDWPARLEPGRPYLEFGGLDTYATVWLNDVEVGCVDNMYIPHRFEAIGLRPGTNTVRVRLTSIGKVVDGRPLDRYMSLFSEERVYVRRMQCGFGWDWVNRFVSAGIHRPASIATYDEGRIDDVFVYAKSIADPARLHVEYSTELFEAAPMSVVTTIADPTGSVVATTRLEAAEGRQCFEVDIPDPRLWWPNGSGDQPLYRCRVELMRGDDSAAHALETNFGIRTIELEQIPDAIGKSFTFLVNGQRIFAKGGNWVPADPFPGRITEDHYKRLLELAREGNVNMFRVWGGGVYEPEAFWDACDRLGILIMQDFMLACAEYPEDDPQFLAMLRQEFSQAIRMTRNHAALAVWSGDNELGMNSDSASAYNGRKIAESVSGPLCAELDPSRPFLPTSPYGGNPNNCTTEGDCHMSSWYNPAFHKTDMQRYRKEIDGAWGRFASECVTVGMPPLRSLRKFASEEDLRDPTARVLEYHNKDNPYNGIEDATHFHMLRRTADLLYGHDEDPLIRLRRMEYVQYEWTRLTCEALRRRKFDCSGLLFWMYNDCWPANGCALVDYHGFAKAGWYGMKRGFEPLLAAIEPREDAAVLWLVNDTFEPLPCRAEIRFQPMTGEAEWTRRVETTVPANGVARVGEAPMAEIGASGVLVFDVESGARRDRAWYYSGMPLDMPLRPARLDVRQSGDGASGTITVSTDHYARVVTFDADLDFSDNYFDLLPGEERTVAWRTADGRSAGTIPVYCWNAAE